MQKIYVSKKPSSCHPIFIKIGMDSLWDVNKSMQKKKNHTWPFKARAKWGRFFRIRRENSPRCARALKCRNRFDFLAHSFCHQTKLPCQFLWDFENWNPVFQIWPILALFGLTAVKIAAVQGPRCARSIFGSNVRRKAQYTYVWSFKTLAHSYFP